MPQDIHQVLKDHWGYDSFRPMQEDIIQSALSGKDTLALLPTGGGKSICFQVPALAMEGICVVISPLIALMKDQVHNLVRRGIPAVALFSGMTKREIDIELDNCVHGKYKFLYVSPERLTTEIMQERLKRMNVCLLAVDEAHCICQWGYDFRPPYLQIAEFRELLPKTPVLALTATATPDVVGDIQEKLGFPQENVFRQSFERKNLTYLVLSEEDKLGRLLRIAKKVKGTGIVYVRSRKRTVEIARILSEQQLPATAYHAGLSADERDQRQEAWIKDKVRIIVATNAFGMGIDKPDVRWVVHLELPDTLEAYFQEAGRGGRDGEKAWAIMLFAKSDQLELERRVSLGFPAKETVLQVYRSLGNYYQLAAGAGEGLTQPFDLMEFASRYNFKPLEVHSSLKFLGYEGLIAVTENINLPSRIRMTMGQQNLYAFQLANERHDDFIKVLLRSYSGLFDGYQRINEAELSRRAGWQPGEVARELNRLKGLDVLDYLPQTNKPQLTFLRQRIDGKRLYLSKTSYEDRKVLATAKMDAVTHYAGIGIKCRSQLLLAYFGETDTNACGECDVCLARKRNQLSNKEYETLKEHIAALLAERPHTLDELVKQLNAPTDEASLEAIRWLTDKGEIAMNTDQKYELRT